MPFLPYLANALLVVGPVGDAPQLLVGRVTTFVEDGGFISSAGDCVLQASTNLAGYPAHRKNEEQWWKVEAVVETGGGFGFYRDHPCQVTVKKIIRVCRDHRTPLRPASGRCARMLKRD